MVKVTLNGKIIAESDKTIVVENNYYFPPSSVDQSILTGSNTSTACPWKGTAAYYDGNIGGETIRDLAWYYPNPKEKAKHIENYVAFYKNKVHIEV